MILDDSKFCIFLGLFTWNIYPEEIVWSTVSARVSKIMRQVVKQNSFIMNNYNMGSGSYSPPKTINSRNTSKSCFILAGVLNMRTVAMQEMTAGTDWYWSTVGTEQLGGQGRRIAQPGSYFCVWGPGEV